MEFYSYNEEFIFCGTVRPQKNPRSEGYLKPARCTSVLPPTLEIGKLALFDEESETWSIIPDEKYNEVKLYEKNDDGINLFKLDENGFLINRSDEEINEDLSEVLARIEDQKRNEYKEKRREEYPDYGDQLDAIWKQLNKMRLDGQDLVQDADDILGKILAVKAKHPKPGI